MGKELWLVVMLISATVAVRLPSTEGKRRLYQYSPGAYEALEGLNEKVEGPPSSNVTFDAALSSDNRCGVTTCSPPSPPPSYPPTYPPPTPPPTYPPTPTPPRTPPPTYPPTYPPHTPPPTYPPTYPPHTPPPTYPPTYPPHTPPPTYPPTPTPPHPCGSTPAPGLYSTLPSVTYTTNCDFCDHGLYTLSCIPTAFACGNLCAADWKCTHFTHIANLNGGTCYLKTSPGSGGAWSTAIQPPSNYVCGYIPKRAFSNILLSICLGLEIKLGHDQHK